MIDEEFGAKFVVLGVIVFVVLTIRLCAPKKSDKTRFDSNVRQILAKTFATIFTILFLFDYLKDSFSLKILKIFTFPLASVLEFFGQFQMLFERPWLYLGPAIVAAIGQRVSVLWTLLINLLLGWISGIWLILMDLAIFGSDSVSSTLASGRVSRWRRNVRRR